MGEIESKLVRAAENVANQGERWEDSLRYLHQMGDKYGVDYEPEDRETLERNLVDYAEKIYLAVLDESGQRER